MKTTILWLSISLLFYFCPTHGMHPRKKNLPILCENPYELPAPKIFQDFMNQTSAATCYNHIMDIAAQKPKQTKEKISTAIEKIGTQLAKKSKLGKKLGKLNDIAGKGFAKCTKGFALKRLEDCRGWVIESLDAAEQKKSEEKMEPEKKSIADVLKTIGETEDSTLPGQIASTCTSKVISCMQQDKEIFCKTLVGIHKKKCKKRLLARRVLKDSVPVFIDQCAQSKQDWLLFFYNLAQK